MRIQTVSVRSKTTGVWVGVLLTLLFFGDLIHRCGDVEKNPGPTTEIGAPTTRSQTRTAEPTLKDVMSLLQSLDGKFDDMRSDMNELKREYNELKEEVDTLKNELTDLRRSNDDLYNENEDLRDRLSKIERVTDNLENRSRRNNVLFYGLSKSSADETAEDCECLLKDVLEKKLELTDQVQFDRVHRLGSSQNAPIIARCTFYQQKLAILKAKPKLKGMNSKVFIGEDFSQRVRDLRKKLTPHLKHLKSEGKRAVMVFDHIVVDGRKHFLDTSGNLVPVQGMLQNDMT